MNEPRFDLLVGSEIGLWIVGAVDPRDVATVITEDEAIAATALRRDMQVRSDPIANGPARFAISAHWPQILAPEQLMGYETAWNLHPGLLPWGRGYGPVFWAIWAGEPAGATLHVMTEALDRGPIVDQIAVPITERDTGGSGYRLVLEASQALFLKWWPRLIEGERPPAMAQPSGGSYHARSELIRLRDSCDVAGMSALELIRLARALAMPGMPGPRVSPTCRLAYVEE